MKGAHTHAISNAPRRYHDVHVDNGKIYYYENVGNASTASFVRRFDGDNPFDVVDVGSTAGPVLVDLDGDVDLDLVVGQANLVFPHTALLDYYENEGNATHPLYVLKAGALNPFLGIWTTYTSSPALDDLDGDADLDLLIGDYNGELTRGRGADGSVRRRSSAGPRRRGDAAASDALNSPRGRVAATPRPLRANRPRGRAAGTPRLRRRYDASRRRRGRDADRPRGGVG